MAGSSGQPRNIAVFIDGTWNRAGTRTPTNVRKLFLATHDGVHGGREQRKLYVPGVGTKPKVDSGSVSDADYDVELARYLQREATAVMTPAGRELVGGATGKGTAARIRAAYHFLCKNFRPKSRDRVFLFGFSRGAFAARSLAGFTGHVGLLLANKLEHVERAYEIYERSEDPAQTELSDFLYKLTGSRVAIGESEFYLPAHFLGVWDTVASLGLPSRLKWFTAPFTEYHQVECPSSVMTARHALALHELRDLFEPLLWEGSHHDLKQVWFAGAHGDVGGGYKVGEDGPSDIALRWMAEEASKAGLVVDGTVTWWTKWNERPAVHHELRDLFLATWPKPRSWLAESQEENWAWSSHHFHRSTVDYLKESDLLRYNFKLSKVNSALRRVDVEAVPAAVRLLLMGQGVLD